MHNVTKPIDVDGDAHLAPIDALDIINFINAFGSKSVPPDALGAPYCDVDGDGWVSPSDALAVVNAINGGFAANGEGESDRQATGIGVQDSNESDLMAMLAADVSGATKKRNS